MGTLDLWRQYLATFLHGLLTTIEITALSLVLAVAAGALIAACRLSRHRVLKAGATVYIDVMRATPTLVVLFLAYFGIGQIGVLIPAFWAAVLGLGLFYAALFAEVFRGGVESVDVGQHEAATALALEPGLTLRRITLPQAFIAILLPSTNIVADLIKDTSLVLIIGLADLAGVAQSASAETFRPMDMYVLAGVLYLGLYLLVSRALVRWERNVIRSGS
jgi:His/Glu/Gln/Arg/opine family amino acid ABC transporter permease subunit